MQSLDLLDIEKEVLKPQTDLKVSEWAEINRVVTSGSMLGAWNNYVTPYLVEPMNCFNESSIKKIILMFSPQTGKTQVAINCMLYAIAEDPSSMMYIMPTEKVAERFSQKRLISILNECKIIASKMTDRKADQTKYYYRFTNGAELFLVWATSASELASESIKYLFFDETDKYPDNIPGEGDPISLGEQRANTFTYNSKMIYLSTPTTKDGYISRLFEYDADEIRKYHAKCPDCGEFQIMYFENIKFPTDVRDYRLILREKLAWYQCSHCGSVWNDIVRNKAVRDGKWIAENPVKNPVSVAFHLPSWYSPFVSLSHIAAEWLKSYQDKSKLMAFVTQYMAEPFDDAETEQVESDELMIRREKIDKVPDEVVILTCGVDIQDDRIEVLVLGWGEGEECWTIEHKIFYGDPGFSNIWNDLDLFLMKKYETESGNFLIISGVGIDTGGHYTKEVYKFVKTRQMRRVFALKGNNQRWAPLVNRPSKNNIFRVNLFLIGTDNAKMTIFSRLNIKEQGNGYIHFAHWCDQEFFEQLTAEKMIRKKRKGKEILEFVKVRARNEILDLFVYNYAVLTILNPDLKSIKSKVETKQEVKKVKEITKKWINTGGKASWLR